MTLVTLLDTSSEIATYRLLASSCLSVRPSGTNRLLLDGFQCTLVFDHFSKLCWENSVLKKGLLTYCMVQSPSWEANWFAASPRNSPHFTEPEGSLPHSQTSATCLYPVPANPVHIPTTHPLEIHPNIIHPSTPRSPQWSPSLRFPHQDRRRA